MNVVFIYGSIIWNSFFDILFCIYCEDRFTMGTCKDCWFETGLKTSWTSVWIFFYTHCRQSLYSGTT